MRRYKGFEWEDQPWFPVMLRQYMTDFLRFVLHTGNMYQPVTNLLAEGLQQTKSKVIIDLCSGAGGAVQSVQYNLKKTTNQTIPFVLTDLYPNIPAYQQLHKESEGSITYYNQPVNAVNVPSSLQGFRTIFSGFHHFDSQTARQVLQNTVDCNEGIAIFDGGSRSIWFILLILIFHPIAFFFCTPFIKPFSLQRLLFTYLLPVVPLCTMWDGVASVLRLYMPKELLLIAQQTKGNDNYKWKAGIVKNQIGIPIAYLLGYPTL